MLNIYSNAGFFLLYIFAFVYFFFCQLAVKNRIDDRRSERFPMRHPRLFFSLQDPHPRLSLYTSSFVKVLSKKELCNKDHRTFLANVREDVRLKIKSFGLDPDTGKEFEQNTICEDGTVGQFCFYPSKAIVERCQLTDDAPDEILQFFLSNPALCMSYCR